MELRAGYKLTEVGIIPDNWNVCEFGDLVNYIKGFPFKSADYTDDGVRIVRVSDTSYDSIQDSGVIYISERSAKSYKKWELREYDLVFSTVGSKPPMYDSLVGKAILVSKNHIGCLLNQNAVLIREKSLSPDLQKLLLNHFRTVRYIDFIEVIYRGNANQASITLEDLFKFKIPLPTTKTEQIAISAALSDADALIYALQKLIAKKRQIKQGAMQTLLTPLENGVLKAGWVRMKLGDVCNPSKSRFNPILSNISHKCVELEHIAQGTGMLLGCIESREQLSQKAVFQKGDILFGKLRPYLRKFLHAHFDGVCSTEIWVLKPEKGVKNEWLYYLIQLNSVVEAANQSTGTKMPRAEWSTVKNVEVFVPTSEKEQSRIATILSDMDQDIAALESKLAKYQQIKQGMMQNLLTGRIRLV